MKAAIHWLVVAETKERAEELASDDFASEFVIEERPSDEFSGISSKMIAKLINGWPREEVVRRFYDRETEKPIDYDAIMIDTLTAQVKSNVS